MTTGKLCTMDPYGPPKDLYGPLLTYSMDPYGPIHRGALSERNLQASSAWQREL